MQVAAIADVSDEDFSRQVSTNLNGAFFAMREGARRIRDSGRIINISTIVVCTSPSNHGVYAGTKAAIEAMTRILAKELGSRGITVNAVAPGGVETDLFQSQRTPEQIQAITDAIPLGRLGSPDDIARVVSFLASNEIGWISGQVLRANGGRA